MNESEDPSERLSNRQNNRIDEMYNGKNGLFPKNGHRKDSEGDENGSSRRNLAKSAMRGAEAAALGGAAEAIKAMSAASDAAKARDGERSQSFVNNVVGNKLKGKGGQSSGGIGKKLAPLVIVLAIVGGGNLLSYVVQSTLPISLVSNAINNDDSMSVSSSRRIRSWIKKMLDPDREVDSPKETIYDEEDFDITPGMESEYNEKGIIVDRDELGDATSIRYTELDGSEVVAYTDNLDGLVSVDEQFDFAVTESETTFVAQARYENDTLESFLDDLELTRDNFASTFITGDEEADQESVKTVISEKVSEASMTSGKITGADDDEEDTSEEESGEDTDGGTDAGETEGGDADTDSASGDAEADVKEPITENVSGNYSDSDIEFDADGNVDVEASGLTDKLISIGKQVEKVQKIGQSAVNITCGIFTIIDNLSQILMAYQKAQDLGFVSTIFEGIQKSQVVDSNSAVINQIANLLTKRTETTYYNSDGTVAAVHNKSAMEAEQIGAMYENRAVDTNDLSVKSRNMTSTMTKAYGSFAGVANVAMNSLRGCTIAQMAANISGAVISGITSVKRVIEAIGTWGASELIRYGASALASYAISIAFSAMVEGVVKLIVPKFAEVLTRKVAEDVLGEDLGNALIDGAVEYLAGAHQVQGGSYMAMDTYEKYLTMKADYDTEIATAERQKRSPFDITSQYTFLGSIVNKLEPIFASTEASVGTYYSTLSTLLGSSISSLSPGASAISATITAKTSAEATEENCLYQATVSATSNAGCVANVGTDPSTIDMDPADVVNKVNELDIDEITGVSKNFTHTKDEETGEEKETETPSIDKSGALAHYIEFCTLRNTQPGISDENINSSIKSWTSTGNNIADSAISAIPVVGDVVGAFTNANVLEYYPYIDGSACVATDEDLTSGTKVGSWNEEQRYYQRFIEDQYTAEAIGLTDTNVVADYIDKYYEENPLDNSYEGILARYSGLTKENVEIALDYMEVLNFIAEYDPSNKSPLEHKEETQENYDFSTETYIAQTNYLTNNLYTPDVRRNIVAVA